MITLYYNKTLSLKKRLEIYEKCLNDISDNKAFIGLCVMVGIYVRNRTLNDIISFFPELVLFKPDFQEDWPYWWNRNNIVPRQIALTIAIEIVKTEIYDKVKNRRNKRNTGRK